MIDPRRPEHGSRIAVCVTGASGCVLALRLCEILSERGFELEAVVTRAALTVADYECISRDWFLSRLRAWVQKIYNEDELDAPLASSSFSINACIVIPASIKTLAMAVNGIAENLVIRTMLNALRMRRPVVAVVRESPLGIAELRVLYMAAKLGIVIVPAVIGFYACPQSIRDIVDFVVGKVLDVLGIENNLYRRWNEIRSRKSRLPDPCRVLYGSEDL